MTDVHPPHDYDDPLGHLNGLEMARYLATHTLCPHCHATGKPLPMSGTAWGLDVTHERGCPDATLPTPERPA